MNGEDKAFAICAVAAFVGVVGSIVVGWPAVIAASIAISSIALSKGSAE